MRLPFGRRVAVALTVPAIAVAGILLAAGVATGSTTPTTNAAPTDTTGGGTTGGATTGNDGATTGGTTGQTTGQTTGGTTTATGTGTTSPAPSSATTSASASPTPSRSPSKSPLGKSPSASPSPSPTASGTGAATAGPAAGGSGPNCSHSQPVTVQVGTAGGKSNVVVDANSCALYLFTPDNPTTTACTGQCATDFPPAHAPGTAGNGVQASNLGSFTRPDGVSQVTLAGHQLYYSSTDTAPGQANAEGLNGTWFLVDAQGNAVQP